MKCIIKIITVAMLALCVTVPVTGCRTNDLVVIEVEAEPTAVPKCSTIEEYLKSEDMQQVEKQLNEKYKGIHTIKLKAEDNKLIYEYTMVEDIGEDFELVKLSLERQLQQGEKDSEAAAYSLKDYVLVENPCIIIRYCTKDGTVITEKEYTSENIKTVPTQAVTQSEKQ